jgi:type I restriction enzyme S subunit
VLFWLRQNMEKIKSNAGGTTFAEISKRGFRPIQMLLPPEEQMMEFRDATRPMLDLVASLDRERLRLALCRDALLPKLISGELRVPETADAGDATGLASEALAALA